jgi:hypothetical protein
MRIPVGRPAGQSPARPEEFGFRPASAAESARTLPKTPAPRNVVGCRKPPIFVELTGSPPRRRASVTVLARPMLLRGCHFPSSHNEGSGAPTGARVQRHPTRASDVGPQAHSDAPRIPAGMLASRRSTATVVGPGPRGMKQSGFTVCELHSASKTRVNALMTSALSGGGRGSGASRELRARQCAGRRIPLCPYDASRRAPLGGRDAATLVLDKSESNESDTYAKRTVSKLSMSAMRMLQQARHNRRNSHPQKCGVAR